MSILDKFRLDGQVAVITGAGRGIGQACAIAFAEAGANLVLGARTMEQLEETAAAVEALGQKAHIQRCDVLKPEDQESLINAAIEHFGKLDILVNNAGGWAPKPMLHTSPEEFDKCMHFNVTTAFAMTRLAVPKMVETSGGGNIINISSVAGEAPSSCFATYGTAKASLSFLTRAMAQEFAPKVRVNAIAVGSTKTSALNTVLTPEIEDTMCELTPMGRLGEVEDISACALYMASPAAAYMTGEIVGVTGGLTQVNMEMPRAFG